MSTTVANPQSNQTSPVVAKLDLRATFGTGKYYAIQCEVLSDVERLFNIPEEKGIKIAKAVATRLGAIFSSGAVTIKIGKANKDGDAFKSISELTKVKNLPMFDEVKLLRAIRYCNEATAHSVHGVFKLDFVLSEWVKGL